MSGRFAYIAITILAFLYFFSATVEAQTCPLRIRGDADCNGRIDLVDYEYWRREYLAINPVDKGDFNSNGVTDLFDYELWRREYTGATQPPPNPPPPPPVQPPAQPPFTMPITMPAGFRMSIYAQVEDARSLALGEDGTVYVGNKSKDKVYALPDKDRNYVVDRIVTIASGLRQPNGVAVKNGALYLSDNTSIRRYNNIANTLDNPTSTVIRSGFISDPFHQWKYTAFGPDGKLYVALGAPCDNCIPNEPYGTISRMNDDGSGFEVYARGIRNSVGFDWHPQTGALWFTDNGRDYLGDNVPPDELNRTTGAGQNFGFPYCYGINFADPEFGSQRPCTSFVAPANNLDAHGAALGMKFYRGAMFPAEYRNAIFIAQHGSWNRSTKIGYRVLILRPSGSGYSVAPFAEGWLRPNQSVIGRPVDILELADGSLLISDDYAGQIYRVVYQP